MVGLLAFSFFFLVFGAVALLIRIFFLLNLQETLRRVSPENRRMTPGLVWLCIIPFFGAAWFIYAVIRISDSLRAEFRSRGWASTGDFGYGIGLATGILELAGYVWVFVPHGNLALGWVLSLGQIVCWIIYWSRIARFKNQLGPVGWGGPVAPPYPGYGVGPGPVPGPGGPEPFYGEEEPRECPVCGTAVMPTDRYCRSCGSPLP